MRNRFGGHFYCIIYLELEKQEGYQLLLSAGLKQRDNHNLRKKNIYMYTINILNFRKENLPRGDRNILKKVFVEEKPLNYGRKDRNGRVENM